MPVDPGPHTITDTFSFLGEAGSATPLEVNESFWGDLQAGKFGTMGWLVSQYTFAGRWKQWEMHPRGEELVYLVNGAVNFTLELQTGERVVELRTPGTYVIVPRGVWHIGDAQRESSMLFITAGDGTEFRPA